MRGPRLAGGCGLVHAPPRSHCQPVGTDHGYDQRRRAAYLLGSDQRFERVASSAFVLAAGAVLLTQSSLARPRRAAGGDPTFEGGLGVFVAERRQGAERVREVENV